MSIWIEIFPLKNNYKEEYIFIQHWLLEMSFIEIKLSMNFHLFSLISWKFLIGYSNISRMRQKKKLDEKRIEIRE